MKISEIIVQIPESEASIYKEPYRRDTGTAVVNGGLDDERQNREEMLDGNMWDADTGRMAAIRLSVFHSVGNHTDSIIPRIHNGTYPGNDTGVRSAPTICV